MAKKALIAQQSVAILVLFVGAFACAQTPPAWNQSHKPFQIYANTYYVGTQGLQAESRSCRRRAVPLLRQAQLLRKCFDKLAKRDQSANSNPFVDAKACEHYVDVFREKLKARIAEENPK